MIQRLAALVVLSCVCSGTAIVPQWPQCSVRSGVQGGPAILINGAPYAPILFVANNQFGRDEVLVDELRLAAGAGIGLFGIDVRLDWFSAPEKEAEVIDKFCKAHPEGYFLARIWLGPSLAWSKEHPDECIAKSPIESDATPGVARLEWASPSSEPWRTAAADMLRKRLCEIIEGPHGNRFIGVTLDYLQTGEWFYPDTDDFMDYSPANLKAFRAWLKKTYKRDKALREAWGQPEASIESAVFPTPQEREAALCGIFRDPVKNRSAIDMQQFQNGLIPETIAYFAAVTKEATVRRSLVGVYYGYTMELNNNGPRALVHSGHLGLGKLLECRDVDMLHAPFSYFERGPSQPGHLHAPVDSVSLHGKLHICEEDVYTYLAQKPPENLIAPGWDNATRTLTETLSVVRRDFGNALTHRCGMWYFDLLSDGRWNDKAIWNSAQSFHRMAAELRSEPPFRPEVAFVVDEVSPCFLRDTTHPLLIQSLSYWRAELDRIGTPVGYYLQSDLPRLPDSVKVMILANPFVITKQEAKAIKSFLNHGMTIVWNYAPDLIGPDGLDLARIEQATGIAVDMKLDDVPITIKSELTQETAEIEPKGWRPRFVVTSTGVDVVARYEATGEVSAAACPLSKGVSIYTATPRLPVGLMREVCRRAGVHLYRDTPGMTGVMGQYLVIHTDQQATHAFSWPVPCREVQRIVPPRAMPMRLKDDQEWTDQLPANTTVIYRLEAGGRRQRETDRCVCGLWSTAYSLIRARSWGRGRASRSRHCWRPRGTLRTRTLSRRKWLSSRKRKAISTGREGSREWARP